jgi:hypothetical protein
MQKFPRGHLAHRLKRNRQALLKRRKPLKRLGVRFAAGNRRGPRREDIWLAARFSRKVARREAGDAGIPPCASSPS